MFERCFVAAVCERGIAKYGSLMAFAKKIWPEKDDKNAAQKLYAIQGESSKTGKPQKLRLDEAVAIVALLDDKISFAQFCFEICERLRLGWNESEIQKPDRQSASEKKPATTASPSTTPLAPDLEMSK